MTQLIKKGEEEEGDSHHHHHDSIEDMQKSHESQYSMFGPDEDPDLNIYFNPVTLLEYLASLEEDNLFKINLVQEDEQALENEKKKI